MPFDTIRPSLSSLIIQLEEFSLTLLIITPGITSPQSKTQYLVFYPWVPHFSQLMRWLCLSNTAKLVTLNCVPQRATAKQYSHFSLSAMGMFQIETILSFFLNFCMLFADHERILYMYPVGLQSTLPTTLLQLLCFILFW